MNLLSMSYNNQFFLFEDTQTQKFAVYKIVNKSKKPSLMDGLLANKEKKKSVEYKEVFDFD